MGGDDVESSWRFTRYEGEDDLLKLREILQVAAKVKLVSFRLPVDCQIALLDDTLD